MAYHSIADPHAPEVYMLLRSISDTVVALKEVVDSHGKRPVYVLLGAGAMLVGAGFSAHPWALELRGLKVIDKLEHSILTADVNETKRRLEAANLESAALRIQVQLESEKNKALTRERTDLAQELSATRMTAQDAIASTVVQKRDSLTREAVILHNLEQERLNAARREATCRDDLRQRDAKIGSLISDSPSLTARGLWDSNRPSARALGLADTLPLQLREKVTLTLKERTLSKEALVELIELLDKRVERRNQCEPLSANASALQANYAKSQARVIKSGETVVSSFEEHKHVAEAASAAASCWRDVSSLQERITLKLN